ncbi:translation initiation factor 2 [Streptomyces beihaiensis]|uniref:Translation initiation factor 2 n=1 Tax=Streptomyces beihaiensis TaxID=2984495 RepID=A0ABT3U159_9ACTN|nr:translation initiation factor 2 [Streptomyces beihaiensis]MCX3062999.1 translation initiation factor 2 [Streptomyces beihaiensis]
MFAVRSAAALHRLLDALPVFEGDPRVRRLFTLAPGSEFGIDALAALDGAHARTVPWDIARTESYDLVIAASPKGELHLLHGPLALLPHGAGFNKSLHGEGSADSASGLDPAYLLRPDGRPLAALHALAHPDQAARIAAQCPVAADRATVVGDPTLDRILDSRTLRGRYRDSLGTGGRRLVVIASTWGRDALLARRPDLPHRLATELPLDDYQVAAIVHPNEHSAAGTFDLAQRLPPEVFLARPYEEWAALTVAADAVVTDHGSTALYAAALGRAVVSAHDPSPELLPGTPMDRLLAAVPRLPRAADRPGALLDALLAAHRTDVVREAARAAFADEARGHSLALLRTALYAHLGLEPYAHHEPVPRLLPVPRPPEHRPPAAHAVTVHPAGAAPGAGLVRVERRPVRTDVPAHHIAAEEDAVQTRYAARAAVLYRRGRADDAVRWTAEALDRYPSCRTAAALASPYLCLVRRRAEPDRLTELRITPHDTARVPDPATAVSALHALPAARRGDTFTFRAGPAVCTVRLCEVPLP